MVLANQGLLSGRVLVQNSNQRAHVTAPNTARAKSLDIILILLPFKIAVLMQVYSANIPNYFTKLNIHLMFSCN